MSGSAASQPCIARRIYTQLPVQVTNDFVEFSIRSLFREPNPRNRSPKRARNGGERVEITCIDDPYGEIQRKKKKPRLKGSSQAQPLSHQPHAQTIHDDHISMVATFHTIWERLPKRSSVAVNERHSYTCLRNGFWSWFWFWGCWGVKLASIL